MTGTRLSFSAPQVWADPRHTQLVAEVERRLRTIELKLELVRPVKPCEHRQVA